MEKNGAISSSTPGACRGNCGCRAKNEVKVAMTQLEFSFPTDKAAADDIDQDPIKIAADAVKDATSKQFRR